MLASCGVLRDQAGRQAVAYGINVPHTWPNGKRKTIDLAIGVAEELSRKVNIVPEVQRAERFAQVLVSCEAKTVMTEHRKSEPRLFDELGSSHEIVHQGSANAIAAGITVVNVSDTLMSPLRQTKKKTPHMTRHKQPDVAQAMVEHLRGLRIRERPGEVGFDAYCTLLVDTDNVNYVRFGLGRQRRNRARKTTTILF